MVLAQKVGTERSFPLVVLLFVVTFGIYGIYWQYKAHHEVFRQFELESEGRDEGILWFILGLVLFQPLVWVYQYMFVNNVRYIRERSALGPGISPGGFLGLVITASVLAFVGFLAFYIPFVIALAEAEEAGGDAADVALPVLGILAAAVLIMASWALQLVAFGRLQASLNAVWHDFDDRLDELSVNPREGWA